MILTTSLKLELNSSDEHLLRAEMKKYIACVNSLVATKRRNGVQSAAKTIRRKIESTFASVVGAINIAKNALDSNKTGCVGGAKFAG